MEEILYVKIEQNIPVAKRQITFHDLATHFIRCLLMGLKKRCSRLRKYMR